MKLSRLSQLSAFGRPEAHLTNQTVHGAVGAWQGPKCRCIRCMHAHACPCAHACACPLPLTRAPLPFIAPPRASIAPTAAAVTLLGALLATTLCIHEVSWFLTAKHATKMSVDLARRHDLDIRMDISFPAIPCAALSVDVLDVSGTSESDMQLSSHSAMQLHKIRLNDQGEQVQAGEQGGQGSRHRRGRAARIGRAGGGSAACPTQPFTA